MSLGPGARLGPYDVLSLLGSGGMGEVYRARDTQLDRDVAIKILPEAFASDPDRLARFEREARTLASLNDPHIAQIYGLEKSGDVRALVLELVEGPTLADRIARGPIPIDEALPIARQLAEALEAAHEQGIIHRDLKPANIKVRDDGAVKVLDFGLAKAVAGSSRSSGSDSLANSPTLTSPALMTSVGVILGTAAYMSPEQAKGRDADKRSDIWAFGCVLYEMLTGSRAFDGEDMTDVLGAVVRLEPKLDALPADVPPPVRALIRRCLEKDRRARVADIAAASFVVKDHALLTASADRADQVSRGAAEAQLQSTVLAARRETARAMNRRTVLAAGLAPLLGMVAAAATLLYTMRPPAPRVVRTTIPLPFDGRPEDVMRSLAITPDGSRIVYAVDRQQLFVRALDQDNAVPLTSSSSGMGAQAAFISPDGQWVGFRDTTLMKKLAINGGPP
jgi:hypothetical protein